MQNANVAAQEDLAAVDRQTAAVDLLRTTAAAATLAPAVAAARPPTTAAVVHHLRITAAVGLRRRPTTAAVIATATATPLLFVSKLLYIGYFHHDENLSPMEKW